MLRKSEVGTEVGERQGRGGEDNSGRPVGHITWQQKTISYLDRAIQTHSYPNSYI